MNDAYFFDTYALIELIKGNSNYKSYQGCKVLISIFNLVELHYAILKISEVLANRILEEYASFVVKTELEIIREANLFRIKNKRKNFSAPDCIGYIMSRKLDVKFLTGDKDFKGFDNVEFVR